MQPKSQFIDLKTRHHHVTSKSDNLVAVDDYDNRNHPVMASQFNCTDGGCAAALPVGTA
jgi:hypothetical protein